MRSLFALFAGVVTLLCGELRAVRQHHAILFRLYGSDFADAKIGPYVEQHKDKWLDEIRRHRLSGRTSLKQRDLEDVASLQRWHEDRLDR